MRKFIHPNEIMLTVDTHIGAPYVNESGCKEKHKRLLAGELMGLPDSVIQVLLFDMEALTIEDVTEDAATLWLESYTGNPDDDLQPEYVKDSQAFQDWSEEYRGGQK